MKTPYDWALLIIGCLCWALVRLAALAFAIGFAASLLSHA